MATDVNLQIINSMTQEQMQSLKDSDGKIPSLANQLIMTDEEDTNLSQLRTKVLWTNPNPNIAFGTQSITLSDGNYEYLEIILRATTGINRQYSVKIKKGSGANLLTYYSVTWSPYNYDQFRTADYISDTEYSISDNYRRSTDKSDIGISNDQNIPIEIIGYYKTPAMIYTGDELHEGNGISIKDGVISTKTNFKRLADTSQIGMNNGTVLNLNDKISDYTYIVTILINTSDGWYNYNVVPAFEVLNRKSLNSRVVHQLGNGSYVNYYSNGETQLILPYVSGTNVFYVYGVKG